jgi:hypothetical protein
MLALVFTAQKVSKRVQDQEVRSPAFYEINFSGDRFHIWEPMED